MQEFASNYYFVFGLLTILGGFLGYLRKKSKPSLIAGFILGVGLLACSNWMQREPMYAATSSLVICLIIFLRFFSVWSRTQKLIPHVPLMILSFTGVAIAVIVLLRVV